MSNNGKDNIEDAPRSEGFAIATIEETTPDWRIQVRGITEAVGISYEQFENTLSIELRISTISTRWNLQFLTIEPKMLGSRRRLAGSLRN